MKNRGFVFYDILITLFILGLITVVAIPIFSMIYSNYIKINAKTEMNYLGESIYENLLNKNETSKTIIDDLILNDEVVLNDFGSSNDKYESKIVKLDEDDYFIEVLIVVKSLHNGGNISDVEFKGSILK
ncbi:MAG: hypothetical protein RIN55_04120 [Tissierellaceae bacterium]|nr:hypothetical protein [Tissierellaceae bacterium]